MNWTKPYCGVQHLVPPGASLTRSYWCTISEYSGFVVLSRSYPGSGFNPLESVHTTIEAARQLAHKWIQDNAR